MAGTWSALEYACHVRDVLLIQRDRVILALVEESPSFAPMHRDERVGLAGYDHERPLEVAAQVTMAAELFGQLFDRLSEEQLGRHCLYNFPAPTERDLDWVGRHTAHEVTHHLHDVRGGLDRVATRDGGQMEDRRRATGNAALGPEDDATECSLPS